MSAAGPGSSGPAGGTATASPEPPAHRTRRAVLLGVLAAVVVAVLVVLLVTRGGSGSAGTSAAASSSARAATDTSVPPPLPTPTPTGPTGNVNEPPTALAPVPLNSPAAESNGVTASISKIEGIQGSANGPGNIAGPAVRVTLHLQNGTSAPISLGGVAINMYYGADKAPASPLDDPSQRPFSGMLAAGKAADGVYVFSVPTSGRNAVTVEVGYQAGAPLLLFTGAVH